MDTLDNMRIGKKLIGSFLIIAIILAVVAVVGFVSMRDIDDHLTTMY